MSTNNFPLAPATTQSFPRRKAAQPSLALEAIQKTPGPPSPSGGLDLTLPSSPPWWPGQESEALKQFQLLTLQMDSGLSSGFANS